MPEAHLSDDFFLIQNEPTDRVEIWIDWVPAVDGDPQLPVRAWREADLLCVQTQNDDSERPVRHFDVAQEAWEGLESRGGEIVVCGVSGVLARRGFTL